MRKCFTNKCSNFEALTQTSQYIGYSLLFNDNYDFAHNLLEYIGSRIEENTIVVYFGRFVHLIFQYLCPDIVFENNIWLSVFRNTLRSFRDMLGTERKNNCISSIDYRNKVRHLLHQRLPIIYGSV